MNIQEYASRDALIAGVAQDLLVDLKAELGKRESVTFVVPGGTTPGPIFDILSKADIDWSRVHVLLSDERWVPDDHDRSNAKLLRERLLVAQANAAKFTPFFVADVDVAQACSDVSTALAADLPVAVSMLGMGADMHTASLFPKANGLDAALSADAQMLCPIQAEGQEQRVTLSASVLNGASAKHIVIFGDDKRSALNVAQTASPQEAPVAAVLNETKVHWAP